MNSKLKKEVDTMVALLSHVVSCDRARGGGKSINGEMLLVFESLHELFGRVNKLEKPGKVKMEK